MFIGRAVSALARFLTVHYTDAAFWRQTTAIILCGAIISTTDATGSVSTPKLSAPVRSTNRVIQPKQALKERNVVPVSMSATHTARVELASLSHVLPKLHAFQAPSSSTSTISSNFNGTAIPAADYIWFNSGFKVSGVSSSGTTIYVQGQTIQFTVGSTPYTVSVPNSKIVLSSQTTTATSVFDAVQNLWVTNLPLQFSGNGFLGGVDFPVPAGGLPGGINPVTWSGTFYTTTPGISLNW